LLEAVVDPHALHYDRNPRRFAIDSELAVADQTIYHDSAHPSKFVLPIMPSPIVQ
jgi:hypothetical protein